MTKNKLFPFAALLLAGIGMLLSGCQEGAVSYADELKAEKKLIAEFIERNNITIIYEEPAYDEWKENEYLELADYCYFNLTQPGDTTTDSIENNDLFNLRYRQYTLNLVADTISRWNTNESAYPTQYTLTELSTESMGVYYAVQKLKYTGAEGKLICPSKLGFNASLVVPYGYDLKLQIRRF